MRMKPGNKESEAHDGVPRLDLAGEQQEELFHFPEFLAIRADAATCPADTCTRNL